MYCLCSVISTTIEPDRIQANMNEYGWKIGNTRKYEQILNMSECEWIWVNMIEYERIWLNISEYDWIWIWGNMIEYDWIW